MYWIFADCSMIGEYFLAANVPIDDSEMCDEETAKFSTHKLYWLKAERVD